MILLSRKSEKKKSDVRDRKELLLGSILDFILCLYIFIMLVVYPFYFQDGYTHIGTDKSVFFRRVGINTGKLITIPLILYFVCFIISVIRKRKEDNIKTGRITSADLKIAPLRINRTDFFVGLYGIAVLLSYLFSEYRDKALWGAVKWYMGLVPQLILVGAYFLISRFWKPRKWMFFTVFPVSSIVFLLGLLNRFRIYPIEMKNRDCVFISTIGNINWYCGYMVSVMFIGIALYWLYHEKNQWEKYLLMLYIALTFSTMVTQGSDSGLVTTAIVMIVMFCLSAGQKERMKCFFEIMLLFWGVCVAINGIRLIFSGRMDYSSDIVDVFTYSPLPFVMLIASIVFYLLIKYDEKRKRYREKFFYTLAWITGAGSIGMLVLYVVLLFVNKSYPGSIGPLSDKSLFVLDPSWGSYRGATWSAGIRSFLDQDILHKLIGVGPDCMGEYIYSGINPDLLTDVAESFGSVRLSNAHNEWITILVNIGLLGLIGFAGMMICGVHDFVKKGSEAPIICGCGLCLLGYTINNVFSFQQSMNAGTLFVIFGMGMALLREKRERSV